MRRAPGQSRGKLSFNDLVTDGVPHELGDGVKLELAHYIGAMRFDRFHAEPEAGCYFLAALAFGEELDDLALARGETVAERFREIDARTVTVEITKNDFGGARREEGLVLGELFNGDNEVAIRVGLYDIAADAGFEDIADELVRVVNGENEHFGVGAGLADSARGFNAV